MENLVAMSSAPDVQRQRETTLPASSQYEVLAEAYRGKRVLLTGHTGFKGSWMLEWLHLLGAEVTGYALAPDTDAHYTLIGGDQKCRSVIADVRDLTRLATVVRETQPDHIFHLAAQPLVRASYEQPVDTFATNVMGTNNLLEGVRLAAKPVTVVVITTDKVYHNREWIHPYRETDRLGGYDPYSASKACAELVVDSYRSSFFNRDAIDSHGVGLATARAGNVIGGGDWSHDRIIPDLVRALRTGETLQMRAPGAVRPWQHVLDPIGGYLLLGARLAEAPDVFSTAYNFGPDQHDAMTVEALVQHAIAVWGAGDYELPPENSRHPHEAGLLKLDTSKAVAELGWRPELGGRHAIAQTMAWYKAGGHAKQTETEILQFSGLAAEVAA